MNNIKQKNVVEMKVSGQAISHARTDVAVRNLTVTVDEPEPRGGTNLGATPTEMVAVALTGCLNVMGHRCAEQVGLKIIDLRIDVDAKFDRRGVMFESEISLPFPEINVQLNLTTSDKKEKVEQLKSLLAKHCPVSTALRQGGTEINEVWQITRP
ncbi:MAG: OsmC family protein [Pseudomonadota bacterium]|nr:OsmC family protein [Pseudomonadota bacterium]